MEFEEKVEKIEEIYQGAILDVAKETVRLPDGQTAYREIIHHSGAVGVLAITPEDKIVLVRQWRSPLRKTTLEIPAGKIDPGEELTPLATVKRELNEEVRYQAGNIQEVNSYYNSVGYSDEIMYFYYATDLKPVEQPLPRDDGEFIEVVEFTFEQAQAELKKGTEICDSKTIMALWYWELLRK